MFRSVSTLVRRLPLGRLCACVLLAASLGMLGCTNLDLRGGGFADNDLAEWGRKARGVDFQEPSHAFSNKARQIDRNLGGSRDAMTGYGL